MVLFGVLLQPTLALAPPYFKVVRAETIEEPDPDLCYCVRYLKRYGVYLGKNADEIAPNIPLRSAKMGDLAVLRYDVAHVAYIEKITPQGVFLAEANYIDCEETKRVLDFNDPALVGFYRP